MSYSCTPGPKVDYSRILGVLGLWSSQGPKNQKQHWTMDQEMGHPPWSSRSTGDRLFFSENCEKPNVADDFSAAPSDLVIITPLHHAMTLISRQHDSAVKGAKIKKEQLHTLQCRAPGWTILMSHVLFDLFQGKQTDPKYL